jgi:2-polyprenyl-3-methyl-5-hydroxy-6-metoxy-1,4-benzoquinol methylase
MKIGPIPENLIERVLLTAGAVPTPLVDTFQAIVRARAIMVASKLGVFEALAQKPLPSATVAQQIGAELRATEKLLNALVGARYLRCAGQEYRLAPVARKWLLQSSPRSLHDNMLHRFIEWRAVEHFEDFVRTGKPLGIHETMLPEDWTIYQRGMRSLAGLSADEVARRLKIPTGVKAMLDLGGSHGYYSVALCRRHPGLSSTIIDLPNAVDMAGPILARENMGERVRYRPGDVLTADLGERQWDLVFISQLLHHFSADANRELMARIAQALLPGGIVAVSEIIRPQSPDATGQTGAVLDLFFAAVSASGSWSLGEIAGWQRAAGLKPRRPLRLYTIPGGYIQASVKV